MHETQTQKSGLGVAALAVAQWALAPTLKNEPTISCYITHSTNAMTILCHENVFDMLADNFWSSLLHCKLTVIYSMGSIPKPRLHLRKK